MSPSPYRPTGTGPSPTPARSVEQRAAALAEGNRIRILRSELKRGLKAGELDPVAVLRIHAEDLRTMRVEAFLCALPWIGRQRAGVILNTIRVAPSRTIGGMTPRQEADLRWALYRFAGSREDAGRIGARP